jgi:hypothetical protein
MSNIKEMQSDTFGIIENHIIIDKGNGEFTSMSKKLYEKQQAEQSTSIVAAE